MILNGLKDLEALVKELNPNFAIDLYSCLTIQVENLHTVGHFKDQFPTLLQYARNLANTICDPPQENRDKGDSTLTAR